MSDETADFAILATLLQFEANMSGRNGSKQQSSSDRDPVLDDDDETLLMESAPVNDFSELDEEDEASPADRRRDPLRRKF